MGMASSRRDVLSRLQPLLQVVILAFGLFCLGIAQDVFIPIALAMLLTFVLSPIVERLQHWHVPRVAAVVVTVVFAFSVLGGLGSLRATLAPVADVLATVGFVVVLVIFMLIERQRLLERIIRLGGTARVTLTTKILSDAADRIGRYLQAQSLINTGFGVTI